MKYTINSLISTLVTKGLAPKMSIGAIIGYKEETKEYLVELFNVKKHPHYQAYYVESELTILNS